MLYEPASLPADQYVAVTIGPSSLSSPFAELLTCARATDNGGAGAFPAYFLTFGVSSGGSLYWQIGLFASFTVIASGVPAAFNPGDMWILAVVGTTLYAIQNGVIIGKVTDATLSGGVALLQIYNGSSNSNVSNFAIGAASGSANVGDTVVFGTGFGGAPPDVYDPNHVVTPAPGRGIPQLSQQTTRIVTPHFPARRFERRVR